VTQNLLFTAPIQSSTITDYSGSIVNIRGRSILMKRRYFVALLCIIIRRSVYSERISLWNCKFHPQSVLLP